MFSASAKSGKPDSESQSMSDSDSDGSDSMFEDKEMEHGPTPSSDSDSDFSDESESKEDEDMDSSARRAKRRQRWLCPEDIHVTSVGGTSYVYSSLRITCLQDLREKIDIDVGIPKHSQIYILRETQPIDDEQFREILSELRGRERSKHGKDHPLVLTFLVGDDHDDPRFYKPLRLQEDADVLPAEKETAEPAEAATPKQGKDVFDKGDVAEQGRPEAEDDAELVGVGNDHDDPRFYKPIRLQEDADVLPAEEETVEPAEAATPEQFKDVFDKVSCFFLLELLLLLVIASSISWESPWMRLAIFLFAIARFVTCVIMHRCLQLLHEAFCRISTASQMLAKCLPEHVVRILRSGDDKAMRRVSQTYRERKYGTALVSDIAGFTSISEELKKHSLTGWTWSVQRLLDRYLRVMGDIVEQFGGEVDKIEGDGLSAFFFKEKTEKHAEEAYKAAKEMQDKLRPLNDKLYNLLSDPGAKLAHSDTVDLYLKELKVQIRIGLYTGYVHEGNFGSIDAMKCGVIGEAMFEAAELEDRCKHYNTNILASQTHFGSLPEEVQASLEKIGKRRLASQEKDGSTSFALEDASS